MQVWHRRMVGSGLVARLIAGNQEQVRTMWLQLKTSFAPPHCPKRERERDESEVNWMLNEARQK